MLEVEQWFEIRRLHRVEKLSARKIAKRLGLARNTVNAALHSDTPPQYNRDRRPSCLDPFNNRIAEILGQFPEISAVRIQEILQPEGFDGGLSILRDYLRRVRPQPTQAFQRTEYRPGDIGQVDWARMPDPIASPTGDLLPVWALILTLGYSRLLSVVFSFGTAMPEFLQAHAQLLAFIGGVPHTLVYDNLSSVVTTHRGKEVIFNDQFLVFAERYGFKPHACTPGQPHEKGLVERPVRYLKDNFWVGRQFTSLEDLQAQGDLWRDTVANVRQHGTLHERPIDRFQHEKSALLPLPTASLLPYDVRFARVTSQGFIQVQSNHYSVPPLLVRQEVAIHLYASKVVIYHDQHEVARHARCWGKHRFLQDAAHLTKPWSVTSPAAAVPGAHGLTLPAKACVPVALPDLSHYGRLTREDGDE
jgi:transposase